MNRVILDHTCLTAILDGDPFMNGLVVEASHGVATLVVPALSLVTAEIQHPGTTGRITSALRYAEIAPFEAVHARLHAAWKPGVNWKAVHPAALFLQERVDGEDVFILSFEPGLYAGTTVHPVNPHS